MGTISIKSPADLQHRVDDEARRRNLTRSALVRDALVRALEEGARPSCADLAGDLLGSVRSGRCDLGSNERLVEEIIVSESAAPGNGRR